MTIIYTKGLNRHKIEEVVQKLLALARLYITKHKLLCVVLPEFMPREDTRHCAVITYNKMAIEADNLTRNELKLHQTFLEVKGFEKS